VSPFSSIEYVPSTLWRSFVAKIAFSTSSFLPVFERSIASSARRMAS
jgi:hypothetical protein